MKAQNQFWISLVAVLFTLSVGCGGGSSSSGGGAATPNQEEVVMFQVSDSGIDSIDKSMNACVDAVVDAGTDGSATNANETNDGEPGQVPQQISFSGNLDIMVDLDRTSNFTGRDLYPNSTGMLHITGTGAISGDFNNGTADYAVQVEFMTDGVFTDPISGLSSTVNQGAILSFQIMITWAILDADNWTIEADSTIDIQDFTAIVETTSDTWTVVIDRTRTYECTFGESNGLLSIHCTVGGLRNTRITNGGEEHTIQMDVRSLLWIIITIDGARYGPYTAWEVAAILNSDFE